MAHLVSFLSLSLLFYSHSNTLIKGACAISPTGDGKPVCATPSFSPDFSRAIEAAGLSIPAALAEQALPPGWRLTPGALVSGAVLEVVAIPIYLAGVLPLIYGKMSYPRLFKLYDPILRVSMVFTFSAWILILTAVRTISHLIFSFFSSLNNFAYHRDSQSKLPYNLTSQSSTAPHPSTQASSPSI
jgi:hypothetical protein